ncbi:coiled-coil domain-containing protein 50 isoform X2 [Cottoperca gobio]|uniref:Coiled-coil domain-containing protein 50 isoform X2 n=1 Tax=Cottoperca gobio TaxID=56716 RepID=A0A6J2PL47_COTGO|nr:coiled-coil domain-containing protein 50 isoform X2 [Cottoperca gobio]
MCRDFAVLEDHCLAYNLQEQEIESHLASNVNKSRLVQNDLQVAKKLQEEEDLRAKGQNQKKHVDIERQDNEIAQEIQEELVRQAELQLKQEEKDAAIARKMQEKEMKEERRRQKQLESNLEEEYFEDHGAARRPLDLDKHTNHKSSSPGRNDAYAPVSSHRDYSPDYSSIETKRSRYPRQDPAAPHSRSRHPEHYLVAEGGRSRHADTYPEHLLHSKGRIVHRGSGAVIAETEYGVSEATKGLVKLDIRDQELKDMEVARKMQEDEIKSSKMHVRAAQMAQDEEIARLMMEREKKEYRKNRDRENERDREKEKERLAQEKMAVERRRPEGDYRPSMEEVVRPRTRDEHEHQRQRNQNKPARPPPQPRSHNYENVNSGYGYSDHPAPPRAPTNPEAAYKGAYYKR